MTDFPPDDITPDNAYDVLTEQRRRETIRLLLADQESWNVDDLARELAAREHDLNPSDMDSELHKRVTVSLLHHDLPKLAETGVIVFDFDTETVAPGEHLDEFGPVV